MSQTILILGAKGTLGQALAEEFSNTGYSVLAWDREDADVSDPAIGEKIKQAKPNLIINATAYNAVDKAEAEPDKSIAKILNADVPGQLALAAKSINVPIIHYSTDCVFKGDNEKGYIESSAPDPQSVYGRTKYGGELNVQKAGGTHYIIRLSRLFGKPGASLMSKKSFVDIMRDKINEKEIKVVNEEYSSPTYAPDLAHLSRVLWEQNFPFGIYHGANSGSCNWFEFAQEIFKLLGKGPNLIPIPASTFTRAAVRPAYSVLLNTKISPQRSWQEALRDYLKKS